MIYLVIWLKIKNFEQPRMTAEVYSL